MPVHLPQAPAGPVPLLPAPHDPPTLYDVKQAMHYSQLISQSRMRQIPGPMATTNDAARAAAYATNVMVAYGAGAAAPAWFGHALQEALAPIQHNITHVRQELSFMRKIATMSYNLQCYDGATQPFEIVPFINGDIPTEAPHNLPALHDVEAIQALSEAEVTAYMNGYGLGPIQLAARKRAIGRRIGCTAVV